MRQLLKRFFFVVLEYGGINAVFRYINRGRVKVLMFHSISQPGVYFDNAISEDSFIRQINYLLKHYSILKLSQDGDFSGHDPKRVNVLLTFDDGFIDNYAVVTPILAGLGLSGVFFVIGECLQDGSVPSFIRNRLEQGRTEKAYKTFATHQALDMITKGMTIGSHGQQHFDYTKYSQNDAVKDAVSAKLNIEQETGVLVENFAFPWGKFQRDQLKVLTDVYKRLFTTHHGFNDVNDRVFFRNEIANTPHLWCAASGALDFFIHLTRSSANKTEGFR